MLLVFNGLEYTLILYTFHCAELVKYSVTVLRNGEYFYKQHAKTLL